MSDSQDKILWKKIIARISREWTDLSLNEKAWATEHALNIFNLQEQLHRMFLDVDGARICRDCRGDCCGHGKYHPTLANILACLANSHPFPEPDFSLDCPYFGSTGCLFPPGLRPFNCISFICSQVEDRLDPDIRTQFYRLEKKLRAEYELFANRYVGAGMCGILIREDILTSYLARR